MTHPNRLETTLPVDPHLDFSAFAANRNGFPHMKRHREPQREVSFAGDIQYIAGVLLTKWLLIALCVVIAVTLGFLYGKFSPKVYAATTVIQVDQDEQMIVKIEGVKAEDLKSPEVLKTYEQNILSPEVLLRVIKNHGLLDDPAFLPEVAASRSDKALQDALARHITAKIRRETRLIDISVEHRVPALAQRIAELLVEEFAQWNSQARREAGQLASAFLLERAGQLNERLAKSEQALQAYKEKNEGVPLDEKQNLMLEKLNQLNLRITEAKTERLKLESDSMQLSKASVESPGELLAIPRIANAPAVADLNKKIGEKSAVLAALSQRYKAEHPRMIEVQSELAELQAGLTRAILETAEVLATQFQTVSFTEQKLEQALREQQKLTLGMNAIIAGYAALSRDVASNRALYDSVLMRMKETEITKDIAQGAMRVVARPLLPDIPVKPKKTIILILSMVAGVGAGCFLAFATHAADRSLRTLQDAEERLGLRSLGEIPRLPPNRHKLENAAALVESDLAVVESFRTLRTSLSLLGEGPGRKNILFTSAHAGEGKTFCAINCAVSFAQLGLKTLLIDADFRLPSVERVLLGTDGTPGMSDLLLGEVHLGKAVHPTAIENLHVLPAGQRVAKPVELFSRSRLSDILDQVADDFDRVVIDTAPVHLVSDTLLFVKHVQYVCLVIRAGRTPSEDVLRTAERLTEAGAPLVGFVWNQVKRVRADHGYYERSEATRESRGLLS